MKLSSPVSPKNFFIFVLLGLCSATTVYAEPLDPADPPPSTSKNLSACQKYLQYVPVTGMPALPVNVDLYSVIPEIKGIRDAVVLVLTSPDGKILLGQRSKTAGAGSWALIGGKVDPGEALATAAAREAREEIGVRVGRFKTLNVHYHFVPENGQVYRVFVVGGLITRGHPSIREPEKMSALDWFDLAHLPDPLFANFRGYQNQIQAFVNEHRL